MAGTITHAYFAEDVYLNFSKEKQNKFKNYIENMKTYGQGHDIFYFDYSLKRGKEIKTYALRYFHKKKTKQFFINIIKYIKDNNLEDNLEILSYLYGYICHYSLDHTIHPYITYKTGFFKKKDKSTYKYNAKHSEFETFFDCYMINKKENIDSKKFKVHKFCFNNTKISNELINLMDNVFYDTYGIKFVGKRYMKDIRTMKILFKFLRYDPFGIKLKLYKFIDFIKPKSIKHFYPISYGIKLENEDYYLNSNHKKWCHPRYKEKSYDYSFSDLYDIALKEASDIIIAVDKVLENKKDIDYLNKYFLNLSFSSGLDCNDKTKNQFFEY